MSCTLHAFTSALGVLGHGLYLACALPKATLLGAKDLDMPVMLVTNVHPDLIKVKCPYQVLAGLMDKSLLFL